MFLFTHVPNTSYLKFHDKIATNVRKAWKHGSRGFTYLMKPLTISDILEVERQARVTNQGLHASENGIFIC